VTDEPDTSGQPLEPDDGLGEEQRTAALASAARADPARFTDVSYYRQSALGRLVTAEATQRAKEARREALLLLPLIAGVLALWHYREDLFDSDVPVRIVTAFLLAVIGWRLARDVGRAIGPRLLRRFDPGTAATVSFLVQLVSLLVVMVVALRIVDLQPRAIALGGAVTAVVLGLAAQSTIGNVIAGLVLLGARPFQAGERVRLQGGSLGHDVEGTVASLGLIYTTVARGNATLLVPNNAVLAATVLPLRDPSGVDLRARLREGVRPSDLQKLLAEQLKTPMRDRPDIALQEVYSDGVVVRIAATPALDQDGAQLADEVLAIVAQVAAPAPQ